MSAAAEQTSERESKISVESLLTSPQSGGRQVEPDPLFERWKEPRFDLAFVNRRRQLLEVSKKF
jgi:hypothetical protein